MIRSIVETTRFSGRVSHPVNTSTSTTAAAIDTPRMISVLNNISFTPA